MIANSLETTSRTLNGSYSRTCRTSEAVWYTKPSIWKGEMIGLGSNKLGWLHTLRSCIRMLMTLIKWPEANVSFVL
ncbi:hypothetical protein DPMN_000712 [Dreissena polymorpha]|uniref:Uncharacterized protein n=1 Tax=Dreissena polymorpha TaxID=45954 RepID=A0A9D4MIJ1_DREPO|nr:hypothetical protein DPMN_000712 [Dreissena polymorpha]